MYEYYSKMEEEADIFTLEHYMRGMKIPPEQVEVDFDQSWLEPGTDNGVRQVVQFIKALRGIEEVPDEEKLYEDHLKRVERREDVAKANLDDEQEKVIEQSKLENEGKYDMQIGSNTWSMDRERNMESASENKLPADQQPSTIQVAREDLNNIRDTSGKEAIEKASAERNPFDGLPEKFDAIKKSFEAQKIPVRKMDGLKPTDKDQMTGMDEVHNLGELEKQKDMHEDQAQTRHQEDERHSVPKKATVDANDVSNLAKVNDLRSIHAIEGVIQTQDVGHAEILGKQKTSLDSPMLKEKLHQVQKEQYRRDLSTNEGLTSPQTRNERPMERQEVHGASAEETPQNTPRDGIPSLQNRNNQKSSEAENAKSSVSERNVHPTLTPAMLAARERIQGIQRKLKRRHQEINASSSDPV